MKQKRIYAFLIDLLIIALPTVLLMVAGVFLLKLGFVETFYPVLALGILLLLLKDLISGRSPGKYFMGLKFAGTPTKAVLVLRNIPLILLPVEALVFLFADKRLGDILFKTSVIADEQSTFKRHIELLAGVLVAFLFVYLSVRNLAGFYIRQKQEYILSEAFVFGSKAIQQKTGEIIKLSKVPEYTISRSNGETNVTIKTKVYGRKENADLIIYLSKLDGGEWVVDHYEYPDK